jgi:PAS domain S-box-containing protein
VSLKDNLFSEKPYLLAALAVGGAFLAKLLIDPFLQREVAPYLFFFFPVALSAWVGGTRPGLFALTTGALLAEYFFVEPRYSVLYGDSSEIIGLVMFSIEGLVLCLVAGALHTARRRAESQQQAAELAQERSLWHAEELAQTQGELIATRAKFRQLFESNLLGVFVVQRDGLVTSGNQAFLSLLGYRQDDLAAGRIGLDKLCANQFADLKARANSALSEDCTVAPFEMEFTCSDGRQLPILLGATSTKDDGEEAIYFMVELTELKQTQANLRRALREAESANRTKTDFLANISHELRTPMNAIIGLTELVLQDDISPEVRENLHIVRESADTLMELLNDLLDFSKMEAGKFKLVHEPFRLRETLDEAMRSQALRAHEKGLEVGCYVHGSVPDLLMGDEMRLRQAIGNLVGNAVKFTEQGEVFVRVSSESVQNNIAQLRFIVEDTGIGIAPELQEKIFAPFTQADNSTTRKYHGSGLGLAITTTLVHGMQGRIWVESEVGRGSRFCFTARFPLADGGGFNDGEEELDLARLESLSVLVVDDNSTNRRILEETLQHWNMRPVMAASGQEALKILDEHADRGGFSLVIVDALMPEMDGFEVAERILNDHRLRNLTILMLSSSHRQEFSKRSAQLGIAAYLEKPISQRDLSRAIVQVCGGHAPLAGGEESPAVALAEPAAQPLNILVVEDTPANQKLMQKILARRGHQVAIANHGEEALAACRERAYDIVLMDVQMPIMDGFQATAALRNCDADVSLATSPNVPIIAMTAHAMKGDRERCLAAGMNGYISKPIVAQHVVETIESVCGAAPDSPKTTPTNHTPGVTMKPTSTPCFNLDVARHRMNDDEELLTEMMQLYLEDFGPLLQRVRQAARDNDLQELERAAHSLKGLAANFEAKDAQAAAQEVEFAARDHVTDDMTPLIAVLESETERLADALRGFLAQRESS